MSSAQIRVRVQARARREELIALDDGALRARVCAPPVDGRANRALCRLIARRVGVAPSRVAVVGGERSREKLVRVDGLDPTALKDLLP